jgi:hypothetical protein
MANIKISQLVLATPGPESIFPFTDNGATYKGYVSGLTTNYIEVTKNELEALISTSSLIPGYFYIISGVDSDLYGGTTIILESVSQNKLSEKGVGLFYNPKYNQTIDGYGIWTRNMTPTFDSISGGLFIPNETVTCDLGGTGTYISDELIEWVNGDWSGATSITGNTSGVIANISRSLAPVYVFGDENSSSVIWGGFLWVNQGGDISGEVIGTGDGSSTYSGFTQNRPLYPSTFSIDTGIEQFLDNGSGLLVGNGGGTGTTNYDTGEWSLETTGSVSSGYSITATYTASTVGVSLNKYELSSTWSPVPFNDVDYNLVADEIIYDYENDKIIYRRDGFGNEVSCTYQSITLFEIDNYGNPIKDFQWGNNQTNWGNSTGLFLFNDVPDLGSDILYGGNDLFDTGNILNTDLSVQIPYTHTQMVDPPVHSNQETSPYYFTSDGIILSGDSYFGAGSSYFTNLYPGLFVMAATNTSVDEFYIDGSLGTDCDSDLDSYQQTYTGFSETYTVFVKRYSNNTNNEPSNNHIIIVNSDGTGINHDYSSGGCDSDFDQISGLTSSSVTKIYYLLMSLSPTEKISDNQIDNIVNIFLSLVDGLSIEESKDLIDSLYITITDSFNNSQTTNNYGVMGNKITDSYFDCLNFQGGFIWDNILTQNSVFWGNYFAPVRDSYFSYNNFNSQSIFTENIFSPRAEFKNCNVSNSVINNNIFGSYNNSNTFVSNGELFLGIIDNNQFHNTTIDEINLKFASEFSSNATDDSYIFGNIINNGGVLNNNLFISSDVVGNEIKIDSSVEYNNLSISNISFNTLHNSSISNNTLVNNGNILYNLLNQTSIIDNNYLSANTYVQNNILNQNSSIEYNTGYTNSYIENNNLSIGYLSGNTLDDSSFISENDVTQTSEISINSISSSSFISNNVVKNQSNIIQNTQSGGSELILNSLDNSFIYNNILNGSTIIQNYLTSFSEILYGNLNNSTIENNSLKYSSIDLLSQCLMDSKNIVKTNFVDSTVNDISENSVVIYDSYSKQVFTNSTGGTRISYYDGSDSLVIGNINDSVVPTLNITGWTAVSSYDVDVYVDITLDGGNSVTERGVVWNTSPYPTVADNVVTEGGTGTGQYTTSLTGLTSGSTIYFRGYAVNSSGTGYTCQDSYDTP